jgi:hypothetical protein
MIIEVKESPLVEGTLWMLSAYKRHERCGAACPDVPNLRSSDAD